MAVNLRPRLGIPAEVAGNLATDLFLPCPRGASADVLATRIRAGVDDILGSHLHLRSDRAFLRAIGSSAFDRCVLLSFLPGHEDWLYVANWTRMGVYDITFDGQHPAFFSSVLDPSLPGLFALVAEGFRGTGFLVTLLVPARLAERLRNPAGQAAIHRFRLPDEP